MARVNQENELSVRYVAAMNIIHAFKFAIGKCQEEIQVARFMRRWEDNNVASC
jgi:hypothetical protein